ncbi:hypothetical protein PG991_008760 [Apiospora marii]|uniref:Isopenicillin N synthase-like Fe(2+) 2OG dioxygenase domain-containing protein n=1 Tax=Apiospora marii TaxID=335849 RepID=A0ABR1RLW6_9PEZI
MGQPVHMRQKIPRTLFLPTLWREGPNQPLRSDYRPDNINAALETVNYEGVVNKEPAEIDKLLKVCQSPTGKGLFFLDLKCPSGKQLLSDLPKIGQGMLSYSGQLTETKMKDYREGVERGFKRPSEGSQTFEISHYEQKQAYHAPPPPALQPHQSEIASILDAGHLLTKTLLQHLHPSAAADLTSGTSPSDTGLKLCLQSAAVPENSVTEAPHTDIGLLTFVSYDVPYLELAEKVSSSGDKTTEGGGKPETEGYGVDLRPAPGRLRPRECGRRAPGRIQGGAARAAAPRGSAAWPET